MPSSRSIATITATVLTASVFATVVVDAPARAEVRARITKSCTSTTGGLVVLDRDRTDYYLTGECKTLRVTADDVTVDAWFVDTLEVVGDRNTVIGSILYKNSVSGSDNILRAGSMREVVLTGRGHRVEVDGQVEKATVRAGSSRVVADRVLTVTVHGDRNRVESRRTITARVRGDRNRLTHRRLVTVRVAGRANIVRVAKGRTTVRVSGRRNEVPRSR